MTRLVFPRSIRQGIPTARSSFTLLSTCASKSRYSTARISTSTSIHLPRHLCQTPISVSPLTTRSQHLHTTSPLKMASSTSVSHPAPAQKDKKDWSATQYLKFNNERTRAVRDLVAQIRPLIASPTPRIFDLGCGPGNSTAVLGDAWPGAKITGVDSSGDMLEKARTRFTSSSAGTSGGGGGGSVDFHSGDVSTFALPAGETVDLVFSNAVFHWLRSSSRIPTLTKIFAGLEKGGVLAIQVPDNYHAHSHASMRDTACMPDAPWSQYFEGVKIGDVTDATRPDLDPIEPPSAFYNALAPLAATQGVDVWRTEYMHVLPDARAIVEWVKGTGLQPFLHRIEEGEGGEEKKEGAKRAFLEEYERRVAEGYGVLGDGRVMLGYRRLFVVAVRG